MSEPTSDVPVQQSAPESAQATDEQSNLDRQKPDLPIFRTIDGVTLETAPGKVHLAYVLRALERAGQLTGPTIAE